MTEPMIQPIIFLDIDGVLNSKSFRRGNSPDLSNKFGLSDLLNPEKVALLQHIVLQTNAAVVVSSSWRVKYNELDLWGFLRKKGFDGPVIGRTTSDELAWDAKENRSRQILQWVHENNVKVWIALDDWQLNLPPKHLICTSDETGLTEQESKIAISIIKHMQQVNNFNK